MLRNFSSFAGAFLVCLLARLAFAKQADEIFNSFNSIQLQSGNGYPMDLYRVVIGWSIDPSMEIGTGDKFSLDMPYVYEIRHVNSTQQENFGQSFDIYLNVDANIASCSFVQAGGRANSSKINCQIIRDISSFGAISGELTFDIMFDAGGRIENTATAAHWVQGINEITFNGNLTNAVDFAQPDINNTNVQAWYTMKNDLFAYYLSPTSVCSSSAGILGGTLEFSITANYITVPLNFDLTEIFIASEVSPFGFPTKTESIQIVSQDFDSSSRRVTIQFGPIYKGSRLAFSTFANMSSTASVSIVRSLSFACMDFSTFTDGQSVEMGTIDAGQPGKDHDVAATVTSTQTWCKDFDSTSFTTGEGKTVTEVVQLASPSTHFVTETSLWNESYTSTYTKNFTSSQSQLTVIVEEPRPTTSFTTLTLPWDNHYTTTSTIPYSSGAYDIIVVVETPVSNETTTRYTTLTKPWGEGFTSTYTNPITSGATEVIVVVETPTSNYTGATYTTVTLPWNEGFTSTYTEPFTSGATEVIVIVETPGANYSASTRYTTVTLPYSGSTTTSFIYPYPSGATDVVAILETPTFTATSSSSTSSSISSQESSSISSLPSSTSSLTSSELGSSSSGSSSVISSGPQSPSSSLSSEYSSVYPTSSFSKSEIPISSNSSFASGLSSTSLSSSLSSELSSSVTSFIPGESESSSFSSSMGSNWISFSHTSESTSNSGSISSMIPPSSSFTSNFYPNSSIAHPSSNTGSGATSVTWTDSNGETHTGIVTEEPTTGSDGVVGTATTTIPITTSSGEGSGATSVTWTDSNGETHTGIVTEEPTTGSDGVVGTATTTIPITTSSGSSVTTTLSNSIGSSSSVGSSGTSVPYMTGYISNGQPHWDIVVPGSVGPWSNVELSSNADSSHYVFTGVQLMVDGSVVSADSEVSDDSLEVSYDSSISESSELVIGVSARAIASEPYTNSVVLIVTTIDGKKLVKRAVLVFDLSATIRENASSISSGATGGSGSSTMETSGESSTGAISVTSGSTTSGFVSGTETASSVASTSTSTVSSMSTTVVTVTSCSSHSCTEVSVTTGVTVVTSTVEGTVTTFTTFCPLPSTSGNSVATTEPTSVTGSKPEGTLTSVVHASSTTVITVTSCSEQKCTKVPTTTGVTVVTSTDAGTETIYTTYCPLSSTVILGQTSTTVGAVVPPASEGPAISGTAGNVGNNPGSQAAPTVATNEAGSVGTAHSAAIATSENASQDVDLYPIGSAATSVGPQAQATAVSGNEDTTSTVVIQVTKTEASAIETMSTSNMPYSIPPSSSYEAAASKNVFSSFTGLLVFLLMLF